METILTSIIAFVTTNIDDIFLLVLLFSDSRLRPENVVAGQFAGISTLIGISFIGSFVGLIIDIKYVGLLGLVPIYIGIKSIVALFRNEDDKSAETSVDMLTTPGVALQQILSVSAITIANGGDNISIYVPLYATLTGVGKITMTVIFLIMTALWCFLARYLSNHPVFKKSIEKYGHMIAPFVFVLLGIYIMYESGTFGLFN